MRQKLSRRTSRSLTSPQTLSVLVPTDLRTADENENILQSEDTKQMEKKRNFFILSLPEHAALYNYRTLPVNGNYSGHASSQVRVIVSDPDCVCRSAECEAMESYTEL